MRIENLEKEIMLEVLVFKFVFKCMASILFMYANLYKTKSYKDNNIDGLTNLG